MTSTNTPSVETIAQAHVENTLPREEDEDEDTEERDICSSCGVIVSNNGDGIDCDCPEFDEDEDTEEEDEDLDNCGVTGREFDKENPVEGCGKKITEDDENIMLGNISYCGECGEKGMEEYPEL